MRYFIFALIIVVIIALTLLLNHIIKKKVSTIQGTYFAIIDFEKKIIRPARNFNQKELGTGAFPHPLIQRIQGNNFRGISLVVFNNLLERTTQMKLDIACKRLLDTSDAIPKASIRYIDTIWSHVKTRLEFDLLKTDAKTKKISLLIKWIDDNHHANATSRSSINKDRIFYPDLKNFEYKTIFLMGFQFEKAIDQWEYELNVFAIVRTILKVKNSAKWLIHNRKLFVFIEKKTYNQLTKFSQIVIKKTKTIKKLFWLYKNCARNWLHWSHGTYKEEALSKILEKCEFSIVKSIWKNGTPHFFNFDPKDNDYEAFEEYKKNVNIFEKELDQKKTNSKIIPIQNFRGGQSVAYLCFPLIYALEWQTYLQLVKNDHLLAKIYNKESQYLLDNAPSFINAEKYPNFKYGKSILFCNINLSWLIDNFELIKNKKIIYIINQDIVVEEIKLIYAIASHLSNQGIKIAYRFNDLSEISSNFISEIRPSFIIISSKISQKLTQIDYYKMALSVAEIAKSLNLKIIYEEATKKLEDARAKKISLVQTYNYFDATKSSKIK